jgi:hypothetical protein
LARAGGPGGTPRTANCPFVIGSIGAACYREHNSQRDEELETTHSHPSSLDNDPVFVTFPSDVVATPGRQHV